MEGPEAGAAEAAVDVGVAATQATAVGAGAQVEIAAEDGDEQARSTCIPSRTIRLSCVEGSMSSVQRAECVAFLKRQAQMP